MTTAKHRAIEMHKTDPATPAIKPIHYFKKHVYGNEMNYMHDPEVARHVQRLTGATTLLPHHIEALAALGHEVKHVPKH